MTNSTTKINDLEYNNQPVWFVQNQYNKFQPNSPKGRLVVIFSMLFIFLNIGLGVVFIDTSKFNSVQFYAAIFQIALNTSYFVATLAVIFSLTGIPKSK